MALGAPVTAGARLGGSAGDVSPGGLAFSNPAVSQVAQPNAKQSGLPGAEASAEDHLGSDLGKGCWHLEEARWEGSCLKHRDSIDPRYQVAGSARGHRLPPQSGRGTEKLGDPR